MLVHKIGLFEYGIGQFLDCKSMIVVDMEIGVIVLILPKSINLD